MVARPLSAAMSYAAVENTKEFLPPPMSALGHKRTFALQNGMSALPPKADMGSALAGCPLWANSGHSARFIYWSHRADQLHMRERIMKLS